MRETVALLNRPSAALASCELTFIERKAIDLDRALEQHADYAQALSRLGAEVRILNVNPACADGVFVEDAAVILDELAVICSMGVSSRRPEIPALRQVISELRDVSCIDLPATLEGGDVLRVDRTLYVGESSRTNAAGIEALRKTVAGLGYSVVAVSVPGCLHLKTCVTALDAETFLMNSQWLHDHPFKRFRLIEVDPSEPWAANTLAVNGTLLLNAAYPSTADKIEAMGYASVRVDVSEFGKAEAGLTCLSLIFAETA